MLSLNHQSRLAALLLTSAVATAFTLPSFADSYEPEALKSGRVDPSLHLQQGSDHIILGHFLARRSWTARANAFRTSSVVCQLMQASVTDCP